MLATVYIVANGVRSGIEKATKTIMPALVLILIAMIFFVIFQDGAHRGLSLYLQPDLSKINPELVLSALGQAFFSLSLGIGTLITYGSYLDNRQNIPKAAAYVTGADISIAFLAGFLIIPAMFVAQHAGIPIFDNNGNLISSTGLVFDTLPNLFHIMGPAGIILGIFFFILLSLAALTSTISLLEVPVAYLVDEWGIRRKRATIGIALFGTILSLLVAYNPRSIEILVKIFLNIGLPIGGLMICLFLGFVWKTRLALQELEKGRPGILTSSFARIWPLFVKILCPATILLVFLNTIGALQWLFL
jgi:NSS family neurotransmitter:Na+ symporter